VWNEHRESTRGRDLDITGLSYTRLEQEGPAAMAVPRYDGCRVARLY
jgi:assimilatory nitrate reductase catalytic subunit